MSTVRNYTGEGCEAWGKQNGAAAVLAPGYCWSLWVWVDLSPRRKGEFVAMSPAMVHKSG